MSITINPIDNGTNVITAVDAALPITVSGTEVGIDGQDIFVALFTSTTDRCFLLEVLPMAHGPHRSLCRNI